MGIMFLAGCGVTGASSGGAGGVTPGQVTLVTSKSRYQASETVSVTIANGLSSGILAADHQSDCTVVVVEYLNGQTWQPQKLCQLKSATRLIPIAAGATLTQQIQPPGKPGALAWPTGTYRVALGYRSNPSGSDTPLFSAQFSVA
ncbi:MAG: hypothetical protein IVW57_05960 [Ktedonobacterales bacterium]|nr:hypothetical protein [Ktedonobacterales bacterium]